MATRTIPIRKEESELYYHREQLKLGKKAGQPDPIRAPTAAKASRVMAIELHFEDAKSKTVKVFAITAYLPCSDYSTEEYDETLEQIEMLISQCPQDAILIIGGDFNASIGTTEKTQNGEHRTTGPHGNSERNERGQILSNFMKLHGVTSLSTHYEKPQHNTWSFGGNEDPVKQIDHIMVRRQDIARSTDCFTGDLAGVCSDHLAVYAKFRIAKYIPKKQGKLDRTQSEPKPKKPTRDMTNWHEITKSPKVQAEYNKKVDEAIRAHTGPEHISEVLPEILEEAARTATSNKENSHKHEWFELSKDELDDLIGKRNEAEASCKKDPDNLEAKEHRTLMRKQLKRAVKEAKNKWLTKKVKEMEGMTSDPHQAWSASYQYAKGLYGHHKTARLMKFRRNNGELAQNDTENAEVLNDHFTNLFQPHHPKRTHSTNP